MSLGDDFLGGYLVLDISGLRRRLNMRQRTRGSVRITLVIPSVAQESPLLEASLIAPVDTLGERVEHTPIGPSIDEVPGDTDMSTVEKVTSVVEISGVVTEFSDDSSTQQDDEVSRDITTLDEEPIGTKAPRSTIELRDDNHLQQHGEHIKGRELVMEGQFVTHVEPMVEEDEKSSLGPTIDLELINAQTVNRVALLPDNSSLWAYIDGACNIARLPLHHEERDLETTREILCVD